MNLNFSTKNMKRRHKAANQILQCVLNQEFTVLKENRLLGIWREVETSGRTFLLCKKQDKAE